MSEPLMKICLPHLYLRFITLDLLRGTVVEIGDENEEGGCIDCDADIDNINEAQFIARMWLHD